MDFRVSTLGVGVRLVQEKVGDRWQSASVDLAKGGFMMCGRFWIERW